MRCDLLEQPQPLRSDRGLHHREASSIAAWMCEALNKALGNRFIDHDENDRYYPGRPLQCDHCPAASTGQNHVWRQRQQFRDGGLCPFDIVDAPTIVDPNIATDRPPPLL